MFYILLMLYVYTVHSACGLDTDTLASSIERDELAFEKASMTAFHAPVIVEGEALSAGTYDLLIAVPSASNRSIKRSTCDVQKYWDNLQEFVDVEVGPANSYVPTLWARFMFMRNTLQYDKVKASNLFKPIMQPATGQYNVYSEEIVFSYTAEKMIAPLGSIWERTVNFFGNAMLGASVLSRTSDYLTEIFAYNDLCVLQNPQARSIILRGDLPGEMRSILLKIAEIADKMQYSTTNKEDLYRQQVTQMRDFYIAIAAQNPEKKKS